MFFISVVRKGFKHVQRCPLNLSETLRRTPVASHGPPNYNAAFLLFFLFVFRLEFVADKHGVQVISEVDIVDGKMCMHVDSAEVHEWSVFIKNTGQHVVDFTYYSPLHWMQCFSFDDSQKVTRLKPLSLHPGENKSFFHFQTQSISRLEICLQLFDSTCWVYQAKCMMSW